MVAEAKPATPMQEGYSLLTGTTIWLSMVPWDTAAIGLRHETLSPDGIPADPEIFTDLIHPLDSKHSIKVFDSHVVELDDFSRNTPFQQGALEIPPDYFRTPMGPGLADLIDKKWLEQFDEEGPPEGELPPSASWDGSWYFYVACWWKVVGPYVEPEPPPQAS